MSDQLSIRPATRQGVRPLIGLYSESGCGKTYSALLLARGFVGPTGKIALVDSESGRGELYADVIDGGYGVIPLSDPFSPSRYIDAIELAERSSAIGIMDSGSHEWEGIGGVLDVASFNEDKSGKAGLHNWKGPKLEHAKFVLRLLRSSIPWIICLRAKYKTRQGKDSNGRTVIIKDDHTTPIQAEDFIFEMTAHAEILPDHSIRITKCSHPELRKCFPASGPITVEHGKRVAQWCAAPSGENKEDPLAALKSKLWKLWVPTKGKKTKDQLDADLRTWSIISADQSVANLTAEQMQSAIEKLEIQMNPQ